MKHVGLFEILAGGCVQDVEHSVAGDEIERTPPLRIGRTDNGCVAAAAGTEKSEGSGIGRLLLPTAASATGWRLIIPVLLPDGFSGVGIERVEVIGDAGDEAD